MKIGKRIMCYALVITMAGCSAFRPDKQTVKINCNVPETILKINGDTYKCPNEVNMRRNSKVIVEAYKEGYDKYYKQIDYHLSSSAKMDIVGTCIIFFPVFGLLSAGAWDLDETEVNVVLNKP